MSDVRALLLTDVVDSTKLSEKIGDAAMAEVWAAHDRVARDMLPVWRGREIDKTDGMLLLFEAASDALSYALAYHRALAGMATPLKARAGLHIGPVILRENAADDVARGAKPLEVDGLAKPTTARVMSLARGGQTLLTPEAREAIGATPLRIESHGHWMIKGLSTPIELFEVGEDDAPFEAPPDGEKLYRVVRVDDRWLPVKQIPNNLPHQATSFIGRDRELDDIRSLLPNVRMVTLLGMGGLGKTRLSLQVAAESMAEFPDGAWFIDLSPLRDPALVVSETAQVFEVREEPDRPLLQTLCAHLKSRRALIIIDNCEHLIKASADLAHALLKAAPQLRIITSSREALHVPGEHTYPIHPLPVPQRGDSVETLERSTAVRLFIERAQAHKPSFALNEREAPAIAELVARLEGIPLALELAAARVRSLSVADINARLKDRYRILSGGARVLQERQQTLRALVDWSYELLNAQEQQVLARVSAFAGGFALDAAEEVCGADPLDSMDVIDLLGSLVEKSLVMHEDGDDSGRYRTLETIREYAAEKLAQSGEQAAIAERHCMHYFGLAKLVRDGLQGAEQPMWVRRAEVEMDNLRGGLNLALSGAIDAFVAVKYCVALQNFWILRGYVTEGRSMVQSALNMPAIQASDLAQAHALYVAASLAENQGDHAQALQMLETCLELRRRLGNPGDIGATLSTLSLARLQAGDTVGAAVGEDEALQYFRQLGYRAGEAISLIHLGQIALHSMQDSQARTHLEEGLAIARQIGHQEAEAACELFLGEVAFEAGDQPRSYVRFTRSLAVCRDSGDKRGEANAICWLGRVDLQSGNLALARERLTESLRTFRAADMREELLGCLEDHAVLAHLAGDNRRGATIAATATMYRNRMGLVRAEHQEGRWQSRLAEINEALEARFGESIQAKDLLLDLNQAVDLALSPLTVAAVPDGAAQGAGDARAELRPSLAAVAGAR